MVTSSCEQHVNNAECDGMWTTIHVENPLLTSEKYTTYAIIVDTTDPSFSLKHSYVRRRYSDFVTLREILFKQHPCIKPPHLPGKSLFQNRFTESFIEKRREGLENFLNKICAVPIYLSNKAVHLFLQSTFTMDEIKDIIKSSSLDFCIAVDYILTKNSRTHEVNSFGYDGFSKHDSLTAFEVDSSEEIQKESCSYSSSDVPEKVEVPSSSSNHCVPPPATFPSVKRVSFSDTVVVALVHK